jgi:phage FluMu protein gp41
MATINVTLKQGLKIGDTSHLAAVIREATAGDMIEATEESERPVFIEDEGYKLLVSSTMLGINTLRRQIVNIGDHPGPLTMGEIKKLTAHDLNLLQEKAIILENGTLEAIDGRGRDRAPKGKSP